MLKIGHRGAAGYEPENTKRSFLKAIQLKTDMIELDVRYSKDKKLVVIHDPTLNRTTNGKGKVADYTLKQLKGFAAGKGDKIMTLSEVIDLVNKKSTGKCKLNIEIKEEETINEVCYLVKEKKFGKNTLISSSSVEVLLVAKKIVPQAKRALLLCQSKSELITVLCVIFRKLTIHLIKRNVVRRAKKAAVEAVCINRLIANKRTIDFFHSQKLKVYVWTVNKQSQINKLKDLGVEGIFSNYPDRL